MTSKTANEFIHTNAEYEKLKKSGVGRTHTPRETPAGQGPGRRGYDKQRFADWTREELLDYAEKLGIDFKAESPATEKARDALIDAIMSRDATVAR